MDDFWNAFWNAFVLTGIVSIAVMAWLLRAIAKFLEKNTKL